MITFALVTTCLIARAQVTPTEIEWQNTIGGNSYDGLYSVQQTSDGGYILSGHSYSGISGDKIEASQGGRDYWVVKLNNTGAIEWQNTIGGSSTDELPSIKQTSDGGYILGGTSNSGISGDKTEASQGANDYWVVKLNNTGTIEWQNTIGGSDYDRLNSVQQTSDGGYILGGYSSSGISGDKTEDAQGSDYWVVKLNNTGVIEWENTIGGTYDGLSNQDELNSVQQTSDGGYILGGSSWSGISGDKTEASQGYSDYWVVKLNNTGAIEWQNTIGGSDLDALRKIQQTSDGGYILGGWSYSGISGDKTEASKSVDYSGDYWVVKLDNTGTIEWQNTIGGSSGDYLLSIQQTSDGGYILGGSSYSGISGDKTEASQGSRDYWVVKLNNKGTIEWQKTIGGNDYDFLNSIQQTSDQGYILGGWSHSGISGDKTEALKGEDDYWVVKLTPECFTGITVYADLDSDDYGDPYNSIISPDCSLPAGYLINSLDCDDANTAINPEAIEICDNSIDENCDGQIDTCFCPVPTVLTVVKITNASAKLKWDAVSEAESYTVRYKVADNGVWKYGTTPGNSKPIGGLLPQTNYEWQVKTFCQIHPIKASGWSPKHYFTTTPLRSGNESAKQISFTIYPNPATDQATIEFTVMQTSYVHVFVCDMNGKEIFTLLNDELPAGDHSLHLNTSEFAKGVYLLKMICEDVLVVRKLVIQ